MAKKFQYGLLVSSWSANFQYHLCSAQMPRDGNIVWKPMRDWAPKPNSQVSVGELKCLTWLAVWSLFNSPRSEIWFETLGSQSGSTRENAPWKLRNIIDMKLTFWRNHSCNCRPNLHSKPIITWQSKWSQSLPTKTSRCLYIPRVVHRRYTSPRPSRTCHVIRSIKPHKSVWMRENESTQMESVVKCAKFSKFSDF